MALFPAGTTQAASQPATPTVLNVAVISAERAAHVLRSLFPHDRITVDGDANAVIVIASSDDVQAMRAVLAGIDVRNPTRPTADAIPLHIVDPATMSSRIREAYPNARVVVAPNRSLIVTAAPADLAQIHALVAAIDVPLATPPASAVSTEAVKLTQAHARDVARAVEETVHTVRASVAGSSVVLTGPPDDVQRAKSLVALIDQPAPGVRYTEVYRLKFVDATSVANLLRRTLPNAQIDVDRDLNAISVLATTSDQQRIADGISQLDQQVTAGAGAVSIADPGSDAASYGPGGTAIEVITLRAAIPGLNGAQSTTGPDIATTVTQLLQQAAPDLRVVVPPNSNQLALMGSPASLKLAKDLIAQLDVIQKLVVLDTEILEVDESVAKNLGISFTNNTPVLSTTYTEQSAPVDAVTGIANPLQGLQAFGRTPLTFGVQLNALLQTGKARVLADPRITTVSGRTASIRAGDNIAILTTTGGGSGTVATTQLQTFQTGVTLDITPVINAGNYITVSLHPTVNSLTGTTGGIPQISTRDTQTTVAMQEGQTLVIGGLIEETTNSTETKIPILGDLPYIGKIFRNGQVTHSRNELIITVTPHIVQPGGPAIANAPSLQSFPTPAPFPTLDPNAQLPAATSQSSRQARSSRRRATPIPVPAPAAPAGLEATQAAANAAAAAAVTPTPIPSPFAATNIFTFGRPPANTYASQNDPVQIFFAQFAPTVIHNNSLVRLTAITTTNVTKLTIGYQGTTTQISQSAPGQWFSNYNFTNVGIPPGQTNIMLTLTASRNDGVSSAVQIPVSVVPGQ